MDIISYVKSFPIKTFQRGEVLMIAGTDIDQLYVIREGIVKVTSPSADGTERLLWVAGRYDYAPVEDAMKATARPRYFYTAYSDGSAYVVSKQKLLEAAYEHVEVMSQLAVGLSEYHDDLLGHVDGIQASSLRAKIISLLVRVARKFSGADSVRLHDSGLNLTHQDIADMVSASREAVSLELSRLKQEGLVDYSRASFTVHSLLLQREMELA